MVNCEVVRETGDGVIGLDFGVTHAVAMSDVTIIDAPKFLAKAAKEIKALNKEKRRKRSPNRKKKIEASKGWKRAQNKVSQLTRKVARKRDDWMHKVSSNIVSGNSLIVTEKLTIKNMTRKAKNCPKRKAQKTMLNRNMLDVGIGMLKSALARRSVKNTPCQCHQIWILFFVMLPQILTRLVQQ